jgi:hypothetical protein
MYTSGSLLNSGCQADGIGGFISALFTVTPLSVFAQNNGVIAITRCANRGAGRWCCVFLILFGVIGKISGVFLAIPNPVLGGVTTFLFATVAVSGVRVLAFVQPTRRDRFVLAAALSFGFGDLLVPGIFTHLFDRVKHPNNGRQGLFNSITIVLSTPCTLFLQLKSCQKPMFGHSLVCWNGSCAPESYSSPGTQEPAAAERRRCRTGRGQSVSVVVVGLWRFVYRRR